MNKKAGVWIDHKKAVIVFSSGKDGEIHVIESNVEKHAHHLDNSLSDNPYGRRNVPADDRQQRDFTGHIDKYYDEVISYIHDAESVFIFGPGETTNELKKHIEKKNPTLHIADVETTDNMTDNQIIAKAREYFKKHKK